MKLSFYLILLLLIFVAILLFAISFVHKPPKKPQFFEKIENVSEANISKVKTEELKKENQTESLIFPNQSQPFALIFQAEQELVKLEAKAKKVPTLEIFDICSGKLEEIKDVSEGLQKCLNKKYPYFILIEKNETHLRTSIYDGFNETYNLTEKVLIYFIFIQDVASIADEVLGVKLESNLSIYAGDYELQKVYQRDPLTKELKISKIVLVLPILVDKEIEKTEEWEVVKVELELSSGKFYAGSLFVWVK